MTTVRLLADDLTGALDTAVRFLPLSGALEVRWNAGLTGSFAVDLGTREVTPTCAAAIAAAAAPLLRGGELAYFKCDSLLRGNLIPEVLACMQAAGFRRCVIAPAFPAQKRLTRNGRQVAHLDSVWQVVGPDLVTALRAGGTQAQVRDPGDSAPDGVSVWNAETDGDLAAIVDGIDGPVLWCGSAGLAGALARQPAPAAGSLRRPFLGLLGSDHPVTARQLDAARLWHHALDDDLAASLRARLAADGVALVTVALPASVTRAAAAREIAARFGALVNAIEPPATLFVTGGETLRAVCAALGAEALSAVGELAPGLPLSRLRGGPWDGVMLISKSGAFGDATLLHRLIVSAA